MTDFRLVCHSCGERYPWNAAVRPDCCRTPDLHIHVPDPPHSIEAVILGSRFGALGQPGLAYPIWVGCGRAKSWDRAQDRWVEIVDEPMGTSGWWDS